MMPPVQVSRAAYRCVCVCVCRMTSWSCSARWGVFAQLTCVYVFVHKCISVYACVFVRVYAVVLVLLVLVGVIALRTQGCVIIEHRVSISTPPPPP
jgi:hypothetical protein